jgi:hypothetical protein
MALVSKQEKATCTSLTSFVFFSFVSLQAHHILQLHRLPAGNFDLLSAF